MKITLISMAFPHPESGKMFGIERYIQEYSQTLINKGHDISIITTFWNGGKKEEDYYGIKIYRVADSFNKYGIFGRQLDYPRVTFSQNILEYNNILKDSDIVDAITPIYSTDYFIDNSIPLIMHYHSANAREEIRRWREFLKYPFLFRNLKKNLRKSDAIIVASNYTKQSLINEMGIHENLIHVVPHGVDGNKFKPICNKSPKKYEINLLFVGRLAKEKGLEYLIKAINIVKCNTNIKILLRLIGYGDEKKHLERLIKKFNLNENVIFEGYIDINSKHNLNEFYNAADIFVFPSLEESFGLSLVEAMACGLPVISTNITSIPEVVGDAGLLVRARDPEDLSEAIMRLVKDEKLRYELGIKGLERVKNLYTWDKTANKMIDLYKMILERRV